MTSKMLAFSAALLIAGSPAAFAQSAGGFAGEPNAETNQVPGPSNTQPADPSAGSYTEDREPTSPEKRGDDEAAGRIPVEPSYSLE